MKGRQNIKYSYVLNKRAGPNKRAVWKFAENLIIVLGGNAPNDETVLTFFSEIRL